MPAPRPRMRDVWCRPEPGDRGGDHGYPPHLAPGEAARGDVWRRLASDVERGAGDQVMRRQAWLDRDAGMLRAALMA